MPDGEVAFERRHRPLVEHVGDQTHVLDDGDGLAVADRHPGRLLPPVLKGIEPVEGQLGDRRTGREHAEHPAGLPQGIISEAGPR